MDGIDVRSNLAGQGVLESTDDLFASGFVSVDTELGIQHLLGLADWHTNGDPVTSRSDLL